jgi:GTP diphosphokinase / guanosine-3',5'-bis(diphosphate) 3'-diphosphatase
VADDRDQQGGLTPTGNGAPTPAPAPSFPRPALLDRSPVGVAERPSPELEELDVAIELTLSDRRLLADLFAIVEEHAAEAAMEIRREPVRDAFVFACDHHADQRRKSGEEFITHPVGVAKICAGMRLDTETIVAALLHDTVEDTTASLDEVRESFGDEVAGLVDGVTKLTGITFQSRDEAQAENYRKMMVAMATDIRVILIKLADRLHNMRTIDALPKQKQIDKAKETLEIYAPIAHRLGIHAIKWELEDLAFASLHPRKYQEIKGLVNQQRDEREVYVNEAGEYLLTELGSLGIEAQISGRAKHFYSIYSKMTKRGREFNEIYDLTAMRVIVDSVKDCYGAVGVVHSLWKPLPGRFKDFIAMPKFNMYQSLHTTVIGPEGRPLEIQIRTRDMHDMAEFGVAAHWIYKQDPGATQLAQGIQDGDAKLHWLRSMLDWQNDLSDPAEFMETLKVDLFDEEVYVFTPKGEVKSLAAGATPLDFAYEVHTEIGHRCVGAKVNGRMVPLHYELKSGDIVEVMTANRDRGPSRDWLALVKTTRARNKIKQWFKQESRQDTEHTGRTLLQEALNKAGLPAQKITGSALLADVIREMGFRKADDFYIALGGAKISTKTVVGKVLQRLKQGEAAETTESAADQLVSTRRANRQPTGTANSYGIKVQGVDDVMLRMAKCCRPVPGDPIVGYVSLGRGITIHRDDCPNTAALRKDPERFVSVRWEGEHETAFKVELQVDGWDRHRLLEDLSRTFAEAGINIVEARCIVSKPMVQNRFVVEVADTQILKATVGRLRNIDGVFDAYRVTPGAG